MKTLFNNWRGYLENPSIEEILKEDLIREFNQSDKKSILASEADFSVSYEIELESKVPLEGQDSDSEELGYDLDRMRAEMISLQDTEDKINEGDLDDFLRYNLSINDTEDLIDAYYTENYGRESTPAEYQAMTLAIAMENSEEVRKYVTNTLNQISKISQKPDSSGQPSLSPAATIAANFIRTNHDKNFEPIIPDSGRQTTMFSENNIVKWIYKNIFNPERPDMPIEKTSGTDGGREGGIIDLLEAATTDTIPDIEGSYDQFYEDFVTSNGRWTTVGSASRIGKSDSFQYKVSDSLQDLVFEKAEAVAEEEYNEAMSDPVDYLLNTIGFSYSDLERFMKYENKEDYMDLLREHLPNFMEKYEDVLKFEDDASLQNGIEFSMDDPPYLTGLNAAIEFLKIFFDDFNNQTNWVMSDRTGLHTNVGYIPTVAHEDRNLFKGMLFLNDEMAKRGFEKRKNSRWAMDIKRDAMDLVSGGFRDARMAIGDMIKRDSRLKDLNQRLSYSVESSVQGKYVKSLGMNIAYLKSLDYIEFRYPGQDEPTYENMLNATLYYAHLVKTINDEDYKKKEYITKLVGFFNNLRAKDLETDKQDLRIARKFFNLPIGTQFVYNTAGVATRATQRAVDEWVEVYISQHLKVRDKTERNIIKADIERGIGYSRYPIFYGGLKKRSNPDLKGTSKFVVKWVFPKAGPGEPADPTFRVASQTMSIFIKNVNKLHLSDPEYAVMKSGLDVDLSDPLETSEMFSIALHAIGDADWRERKNKEKEGEGLDELKFTFSSMNNSNYVKFLRWYKEQYRAWKRERAGERASSSSTGRGWGSL